VERYVIRGGREGYERLRLLARDRWTDTSDLFRRAGLSPAVRCVDLGCGGGEVTFEIARLIGPDGLVAGVDMDEVKLDLARRSAAERGVRNVSFRALNVNDWSEPDAYDFVYCRFLLQHLSRPVDLLRRMWEAVRQGGVIVVEDADFDGWYCHPPNDGLDFFLRTYSQVIKRRGGDHGIGRKLYGYFLDAGVPAANVSVVQSVHTVGEGKTLALSTLDATADAVVSEELATRDEVNAALTSLSQFTGNPRSLIGGPRIFQLWCRRSA
jgi:ubiquinone/menaquinone biosynthesis C-methylase UbiE